MRPGAHQRTKANLWACIHSTAFRRTGVSEFPANRCLALQSRELKVRDLVRLVETDGWRHVRTTGRHPHYKQQSKPNVVTVPGHPGDDVLTGTLKSILKAAGLETKP